MWQYIGYKPTGYNDCWYCWTNASGGGYDCTYVRAATNWTPTNIPPAEATIEYGSLNNYNGDIIALMNDCGITPENE